MRRLGSAIWLLVVLASGILVSTPSAAVWEALGEMRGGGGKVVQAPSGELYVVGGTGIFRSADAGESWTLVLSEAVKDLDIRADRILAGTPSGKLLMSTNEGLTWRAVSPQETFGGSVSAIASSPSDANVIYVTATGPPELGGLEVGFGTDDGGATWHSLTAIADTVGFTAVFAVDPGNPDVVYAGGRDNMGPQAPGVYRSTDGGATWSTAVEGLPESFSAYALAMAQDDGSTAYVSGKNPYNEGGVYLTRDGGATWTRQDTLVFDTMAFDPKSQGVIYGGVGTEVFKSSDGGTTWQKSDSDIGAGHTMLSLTPDVREAGRLYAGASGVFRSDDDGISWTEVTGVFGGASIRTIAIDQNSPRLIYAGSVLHWRDRQCPSRERSFTDWGLLLPRPPTLTAAASDPYCRDLRPLLPRPPPLTAAASDPY